MLQIFINIEVCLNNYVTVVHRIVEVVNLLLNTYLYFKNMLLLLLLLPLLLVKLLLNHQLLYFGRLPPRPRLECAMSSGGLYASTSRLCLVAKQRQVVLTVPASIEIRTGGPWFWRFVISFDVMTGKAVCGFRSPRGWSGWMGYLDDEQVSQGGCLQRGPFQLRAEDEEHEVHECYHSAEAVM